MQATNGKEFDLDLASYVQEVRVPKSSPTCSWGCCAMKNRMAQGVEGDYFDILSKSDACQILLIGDVAGHDLHASLVMALLYGFIHKAFRQDCSCLDIVGQLNDLLLTADRFLPRCRDPDETDPFAKRRPQICPVLGFKTNWTRVALASNEF